nr:hypothetical protein 30 [Balneolaceae bacterium]
MIGPIPTNINFGDVMKKPDIGGDIWSLIDDINMAAGYTPLQAMKDVLEGKEPPLRIQVSRSDNRLVKRIYLDNRRKMDTEMFTFWEQEFVRLCKEDGLI